MEPTPSSPSADRSHSRSCLQVLFFLLLLGWLLWLIKSLLRLCRLINRDRGRLPSNNVPSWDYRQPDPLIYSQPFLMAQGLAVTWDNPDVHMELATNPGVVVGSHDLQPATDYLIVAHIWNGSTSAPAVGLPVHFAYLDFGIGTTKHNIGGTTVDLPVKGAAGTPALATMQWKTPPQPGHYCLQVELIWSDDLEPGNNLGQHNLVVQPLNSPRATFRFPLHNPGPEIRTLRLLADAYRIPPLQRCPPDLPGQEAAAHRRLLLAQHNRAVWPLPADWQVTVHPREAQLAIGESITVEVDVTAPDGFNGRQAFNVLAMDGDYLLGGVTLYADGSG